MYSTASQLNNSLLDSSSDGIKVFILRVHHIRSFINELQFFVQNEPSSQEQNVVG